MPCGVCWVNRPDQGEPQVEAIAGYVSMIFSCMCNRERRYEVVLKGFFLHCLCLLLGVDELE